MGLFKVNKTASKTSGRKYGWTLETEGATYNAFPYEESVTLPYSTKIIAAKSGSSLFKAGGDTPLLIEKNLDNLAINLVVIALGYIPEKIETFQGESIEADLTLAVATLNHLTEEREEQIKNILKPLELKERELLSKAKDSLKSLALKKEIEKIQDEKSDKWKAIKENFKKSKQKYLDELSKKIEPTKMK